MVLSGMKIGHLCDSKTLGRRPRRGDEVQDLDAIITLMNPSPRPGALVGSLPSIPGPTVDRTGGFPPKLPLGRSARMGGPSSGEAPQSREGSAATRFMSAH